MTRRGSERRPPRLAVAAWAAGTDVAPAGRRGKKVRRRARKIAAALAAILVTSTLGGTGALAGPSFYEASPHVGNAELIDAGSKTFDARLAIGEPESTSGNAIAARTLEDAILTGGLSPDDMEMPDMMLAGISGDQMALAAAEDESAPAGEASEEDPAANLARAGATVEDLAKDAAEGNPDGFASPALGGDPEPIMDEYAATASDEEAPAPEDPAATGVEVASVETEGRRPGAPVSEGEVAGAAPTMETAEEPAPTQSDELAYTPVSGDEGFEESADRAPDDSGAGGEPATSPSPPAEPEDDPGTGLASAEVGSSEDAYASPPTEVEAAGSPGTQPEQAPPEQAASDGVPPADLPRPYGFEEEEADDYAQGTPPDHSSVSENAPDDRVEAQHEVSEPGSQHQTAAVALVSDDEGASEDAPPEIAPETAYEAPPEEPPGRELEQGQGEGGDDAPSEGADADAAGVDQAFSDPEGTVEGRPPTGEQPQGVGPQAQEGQNPEDETPLSHGQAGGYEPSSAVTSAADGDAEGGTQEGAAPGGDPGAIRPASRRDDAPARPAGDAAAQDRSQRPQQQRDPAAPANRAPEFQQPPRPEPQPDDADGNTHVRSDAGSRPEPDAQDEPGTQTFAEPKVASSRQGPDHAPDRDRRAETAPTRDATAPERPGQPDARAASETAANDRAAASDELRATPKDGAERTPPVWERQGLPEDDRSRDRSPEDRAVAQQPAPAAEQAREDRRAERQAELRADHRAELRAVRKDRQAERQAAQQQEERRAGRRAERQAELREARRAERVEAKEVSAQEAAARAALRQQRRAERAAESAAEVQGFADQTQPRNLPGAGGGQRWDAPAVEPSLPAPRARRWTNPQPVEPVIAEPAYRKPAPVRTPGAAAGGFDPAPRVAANPVATETSPVPSRQAGGGFGGNAAGGAVNNLVGSPIGNVGGGGAANPVGGRGSEAAGALKGVTR